MLDSIPMTDYKVIRFMQTQVFEITPENNDMYPFPQDEKTKLDAKCEVSGKGRAQLYTPCNVFSNCLIAQKIGKTKGSVENFSYVLTPYLRL